jgi:hypothetical protein
MGYRGPDRGGEGNAGLDLPIADWAEEDGVDQEVVRERLETKADEYMASKAAQFGPEQMRNIEKQILLQTIDQKWREHLLTLEHLRSVVGFRGYAQRDPLNEYKTESFQLFERMLDSLRTDVSSKLARIQPLTPEQQAEIIRQLQAQQAAQEKQLETADISAGGAPGPGRCARAAGRGFDENDPATWGNPGRNDPAPADRARSSSIATDASPDGYPQNRSTNATQSSRQCHDCLPNPAAFAGTETPSASGGVRSSWRRRNSLCASVRWPDGRCAALFAAQAGVLPGLELGSETTSASGGPAPVALSAVPHRPGAETPAALAAVLQAPDPTDAPPDAFVSGTRP